MQVTPYFVAKKQQIKDAFKILNNLNQYVFSHTHVIFPKHKVHFNKH